MTRRLLVLLLALSWTPISALAQVAPLPPLPLPPPRPKLPEKPPPVLPPPLVPPAPAPEVPPAKPEAFPAIRVFVREIRLVGNTVFTAKQLAEVTKPYLNRELATEDFEALRLALTYYYINRGYVTSGAILPDQPILEGVVTIQIIEGKLARINVEGNRWFWESYYRNRVALGAGPPVNINVLQERLQLLQTDPRLQRLNAELKPGVVQGESVLDVRVAEAIPFKLRLEFNNFQSPVVGAEQGLVTVEDQSLLGFGDMLSLQYGRSKGVDPLLNFRYALPINAYDTTVSAFYRRFVFAVQQEPFKALDIKNEADIYGVSIRHPLYRSLAQEFALGLSAEHERNESTLLGQPFDFVPGTQNGIFRVSALRISQEYVYRTSEQVFSAFSRFSIGIAVLDATASASRQSADGRFLSWLGEAQWVRQLPFWRTQLVSRGVMQLSRDHLFPLEQVAVGGRYSVRAYREYTLVRDNAALASVEARVPILTSAAGVDLVHLASFVDYGRGWSTAVDDPSEPPRTLASVGIGLLWNIYDGSRFEVYWGRQLNHFRAGNENLQDHGIHFQFVAQAF